MMIRTTTVTLAAMLAAGTATATAQLQQDDLVIGLSAGADPETGVEDTFRIVRPTLPGNEPGVTELGGSVAIQPSPWQKSFIQSIEFDNANGISHNAQGNLLGANFGGAFTGFEVFNFATDGTGNFESVWSIVEETGGTRGTDPSTVDGDWRSERGGGLSVNPANDRIAWTNFDTGALNVLQYDAGPNPGSGSGASVTGWLETGFGDGNGNAGSFEALQIGSTQGTTWLDDNRVAALNGFGELITLDVSSQTFGGPGSPNQTSDWIIAETPGFGFGNAGFTDLYHNEAVAPGLLIGSGSQFSGSTSNEIIVWDSDTFDELARIDLSNSSQTAREIALDSKGNLYIGGFGADIVSVIDDFVAQVENGTLTDDSSVLWFQNDFFASFSGLDVASGAPAVTPGDLNGDGVVDGLDIDPFVQVLTGGAEFSAAADLNGDGTVDGLDIDPFVQTLTGGSDVALAAIPEPGTFALIGLGGLALLRRRRA